MPTGAAAVKAGRISSSCPFSGALQCLYLFGSHVKFWMCILPLRDSIFQKETIRQKAVKFEQIFKSLENCDNYFPFFNGWGLWSGLGVLSVEGGVAPVFVFYANSGHDPMNLRVLGTEPLKKKITYWFLLYRKTVCIASIQSLSHKKN